MYYFHQDLNKDGHLSFNDLLWAKDKICFMSGWKIGSDKYKETETLFKSIWATLELLADIDKDGSTTKDKSTLIMRYCNGRRLPKAFLVSVLFS